MGVKSNREMSLRSSGINGKTNVGEAQNAKKYLYSLATAKFLQGYQILYREKEYFFWYQNNINYLIQFYSLWRREPVELTVGNRMQWYEWTLEKKDVQMVHAPVANFVTTLMRDLVFTAPVEVNITNNEELNTWLQEALEANSFNEFIKKADMLESVGGTIAIKANYDPEVCKFPILEFYELDKIDYMEKFGRITEVITVDNFTHNTREYSLVCRHSRRGIFYELYRDGNRVEMSEVYDEDDMPRGHDYGEEYGPVLAIWKKRNLNSHEFYNMQLGKSDYEGLIDTFQMCDETFSRYINQIRATQPILFMSEELMGFRQGPRGEPIVNKPVDLGMKVYEMSGGLANVDGRAIMAMFTRDVPELTGVWELQRAFEWLVRTCLINLGLAPSTGNMAGDSVGSNTTGAALFKREQSSHLLRKSLADSWIKAIKEIVRLLLRWKDIIEGQTVPNMYDDIDIEVCFPELDMDDLTTRLDQAVAGFTAGLFNTERAVDHAFKNILNDSQRKTMVEDLERQAAEELARDLAGQSHRFETPGAKADAIVKMQNITKRDT